MKKLAIISIVFSLLFFIGIGNGWTVITLPTANFSGNAQTTATVGSDIGSLTLVNAVILKVNYLNGTSTTLNTILNTIDETIIGKTVTISGANRTGDYTFSDAIFTITDGSFTYFSATLSNIVFVTDGLKWYLNPSLDVNNPATLNLTNIVLHTDVNHPSRYIDELNSVKGTTDAIGMKMILQIISGTITGDSTSDIFTGLIKCRCKP